METRHGLESNQVHTSILSFIAQQEKARTETAGTLYKNGSVTLVTIIIASVDAT